MKVVWKPKENLETTTNSNGNKRVNINPDDEVWIQLSKISEIIKGNLPKCLVSNKAKYELSDETEYAAGKYELRSYDDELKVIREDKKGEPPFKKEIPLKEWLGINDNTN